MDQIKNQFDLCAETSIMLALLAGSIPDDASDDDGELMLFVARRVRDQWDETAGRIESQLFRRLKGGK